MPKKKIRTHLHHCAKSVSCVTGVVFIWYGIWWFIEYVSAALLPPGYEIVGAIAALMIGFGILYLPDRDLDELD